MDLRQPTHDHNYRRFEQQSVAVQGGPPRRAGRRRGWRRQAINQIQHRDKRRGVPYHIDSLRFMDRYGNLYDAEPAAIGASRRAVFIYPNDEL